MVENFTEGAGEILQMFEGTLQRGRSSPVGMERFLQGSKAGMEVGLWWIWGSPQGQRRVGCDIPPREEELEMKG